MNWRRFLFSFDGRIGRSQWWAAKLGIVFVYVLVMLFVYLAANVLGRDSAFLSLVVLVFVGFGAWADLATTVKRLHDRGHSGMWIFMGCIPFVGPFLILIECGCKEGHARANQYGSPPDEERKLAEIF